MNIVTVNDLSMAIEEKLDIDTLEAKKYANIIMDFFGFEDRIIDNALEQKDRQLFYMLEAQGLLHTERENILLLDGRQWRIHYWLLAKNTILRYSNNQWINTKNKTSQSPQHDTVYSCLSKDMWTTRKNSSM